MTATIKGEVFTEGEVFTGIEAEEGS